jgi:hypothetical protein
MSGHGKIPAARMHSGWSTMNCLSVLNRGDSRFQCLDGYRQSLNLRPQRLNLGAVTANLSQCDNHSDERASSSKNRNQIKCCHI